MRRRSCATRSGGSWARTASTCSAARPAPTSSAGEILASAQKAFSFTTATRVVSGVVLTLAGFFLTLVLIAYIMVGAPKLTRGAIWLIPPDRRAGVERLLPKIVPVVQHYFIGLFIIVCSTFVLAWLGWGALLHLPHAMLLSVAVALLETIPALGPLASGVLAGAASLQEQSLGAVGFTIVYVIALRLFIDNVVCPLVLGRATALPAVVVIFALIVGGLMFGLPGFLLAVPAAAVVRIVLKAIYERLARFPPKWVRFGDEEARQPRNV